jgi:hypothetical protein
MLTIFSHRTIFMAMQNLKTAIALISVILLIISFSACCPDSSTTYSPLMPSAQTIKEGSLSAIADFWGMFLKYQSVLDFKSPNNPVYDKILQELQKIDPGLYFEYSNKLEEKVLIITAEGKRTLFPIVDSIVAQAPDISGWKIFALRPKEGFPVIASYEGFTIKISDVFFYDLESEDSNDLGIEFIVPGLKDVDILKCHGALLIATDHGLGERRFAESVIGTRVIPLPEGADVRKYLPLTELESFIIFREKKLGIK